jgi:hypothetical protein
MAVLQPAASSGLLGCWLLLDEACPGHSGGQVWVLLVYTPSNFLGTHPVLHGTTDQGTRSELGSHLVPDTLLV